MCTCMHVHAHTHTHLLQSQRSEILIHLRLTGHQSTDSLLMPRSSVGPLLSLVYALQVQLRTLVMLLTLAPGLPTAWHVHIGCSLDSRQHQLQPLLCHFSLLLFQRQTERDREKVLHLLVASSSANNRQGWARKTRIWELSLRSPTWVYKGPKYLNNHLLPPREHIRGKLEAELGL